MTRIDVKPELVRWARERAGIPLSELARRFPKLATWESGEAKPTLKQLEEFAKATFAPFGFLLLPKPPEEDLPIPDFRTARDTPVRQPSPNLLDTVYAMQRRQDWMRDFLVEQGASPLDFVGSTSLRANPVHVAAEMRKTLGFPAGWAEQEPNWTEALRSLRNAIETARILVFVNGIVGNNTHRKLEVREFRGFVLVDEYAPLVFVNGSDAKAAQMFTLAHELAHLWLGSPGVFNLPALQPADVPVERFCNRVAAEFLIPESELRPAWSSVRRSKNPFEDLARRFKVSAVVAARRALDLQLISRKAFFDFYESYERDERRRQKKATGGNFYATQEGRLGHLFGSALVQATLEGRMLYREAYALSGLSGRTFDRFADSLGFRVAE